MGEVVQFRLPVRIEEEQTSIDLLSAVDFALRDFREITPHIGVESAREQAEACRRMLQEAFDAAMRA